MWGRRAGATLEAGGDGVCLRVTDTGRGIDPAFLPNLFKPFAQQDDVDHRSGMGLGLSIAASVVSLHGGSITAGSEGEGRGATFTVLLPVRGGPPAGRRRTVGPDTRCPFTYPYTAP